MCVVSINVPEEILLDLHEEKMVLPTIYKKCLQWICIRTRKYHWDIVQM